LAAGEEDAVHVALAPLCAIGNQWWLDATAGNEAESAKSHPVSFQMLCQIDGVHRLI